MKAKKNILVLTSRLPYPVIGGDKLRIYNICDYLNKAGYKLTLVSFVENDAEEKLSKEAAEGDIFFKILTVKLPKYRSYINSFCGLFGKNPLQISYYFSKKMMRLVNGEIASGEYDFVLVHLIRMAPYVIDKFGIGKILEMTDAISLNYKRSREQGGRGVFGKIYLVEEKRVRNYEKKCAEKFDNLVVVSEADKEYMFDFVGEKLAEKIKVISNGASEKFIKFTAKKYDPNLIVFFGNMRTYQNQDAIIYFIEKIYPKIKGQNPEIKLRIVGNSPSKKLLKFNGKDGIEIIGKVDNVIDYIKHACISVCPMRIGAGVQNKIIESMALGLPVVTTPISAKGINGKNGEDFLVADREQEFAEAVLKIINSVELRNEISENAKRLIIEEYQWDKQLKGYLDLF